MKYQTKERLKTALATLLFIAFIAALMWIGKFSAM
jgi:hypothetical protein